jgi:hypothetical protein
MYAIVIDFLSTETEGSGVYPGKEKESKLVFIISLSSNSLYSKAYLSLRPLSIVKSMETNAERHN